MNRYPTTTDPLTPAQLEAAKRNPTELTEDELEVLRWLRAPADNSTPADTCTQSSASHKPVFTVERIPARTMLKEMRFGAGLVVEYTSPGCEMWGVYRDGTLLWTGERNEQPCMFARKGVAKLEAAYQSRLAIAQAAAQVGAEVQS